MVPRSTYSWNRARFLVPFSSNPQRHIDTNTLELYLRGHPQPHIVNYVLMGLRYGFDIGSNGTLTPVHRKNNKSARDNPTQITQAIAK